jgi:hypothetical protein
MAEMSTITLMAPDQNLRLMLNFAVRTGVDGSSDPLVMITFEESSHPHSHPSYLQRRTNLIDQLQLSGWRPGGCDAAEECPPPSPWNATWDASQTLRLLCQRTAVPFVSVEMRDPDTQDWRQALHTSAHITALFITARGIYPGGANAALQAIADGEFIYVTMPLRHV